MTEVSILFLTDCTGSMSTWINQVKTDINNVVDTVVKDFSEKNLKINLSFVGYRDWCDGARRIEPYAFTNDVEAFKNNVANVKADGGGDEPEDVLGGIQAALNMDFKGDVKVIYHILDAPPHGKTFFSGSDSFPDGHASDPNWKDLITKMRDDDIRYFVAKLNDKLKLMIDVFQAYGNEIGYCVNEGKLSNVSEFLQSVVDVVSHAIRISDKPPSVSDKSSVSEIVKEIDEISHDVNAYVGIDFGTDGTAFSYAIAGSSEVHVDQDWTKKEDIKDRTHILLDKNKKFVEFGSKAFEKYQTIKEKNDYYFFEGFKMSLYDDRLRKIIKNEKKESKEEIDTSEDDEKDEIKKIKDDEREEIILIKAANGQYIDSEIVFTEALKFIKMQVMKTLSKKANIKNVSEISWILTVPAIWSNHAKYMMQRSATNAGMICKDIRNHLRIAYEPECASVVVKHKTKYPLKKGDKYMLLDLGGGTADIACHEFINQVDSHQIYVPSGGPWGSAYIDMEYMLLIEKIFGKEIIEKFKLEKPTEWIQIKENFRNSKHSYKGGNHDITLPNSFIKFIKKCIQDGLYLDKSTDIKKPNHIVQLFKFNDDDNDYDNKYICLDDEFLKFNHIVWASLFNRILLPLFEESKRILKRKELEGCKVIFCVGGASESKYLQQRMEEEFKDKYSIATIARPILAIAEGAVRFGWCPTLIAEFRCDGHYGICVRTDYDAKIHDEKQKFFDYSTKKYAVDGAFKVFFEKNALIRMSELPCHVINFVPASARSEKVRIALYRSEKDDAPLMVTDCQLAGDRWFKLPKDFKAGDVVPIIFRFEGTLIKVYVGLKGVPDKDREITLKWKR